MPKKNDPAVKERALRMFADHRQDYPSDTALADAVANKLGIGRETARRWLVQADVNAGARPGVTSSEAQYTSLRFTEPLELEGIAPRSAPSATLTTTA